MDKEEVKDWFKKRKISYYHEEEKGLLFLQFCSIRCPIIHGFSNSGLEELEFEELQGLLFMFSVSRFHELWVCLKSPSLIFFYVILFNGLCFFFLVNSVIFLVKFALYLDGLIAL